MHNLIITLIAIALFSVVALSGANYLDTDSISAKHKMFQIQSGFSQVSTGIITFRNLFKKYPANFNQFTPHIVEIPDLPERFSWEQIGKVAGTGYIDKMSICISGDAIDSADIKAYSELNDFYSEGSLILTADCSSSTEIATPTVFPANVKIIYTLNM